MLTYVTPIWRSAMIFHSFRTQGDSDCFTGYVFLVKTRSMFGMSPVRGWWIELTSIPTYSGLTLLRISYIMRRVAGCSLYFFIFIDVVDAIILDLNFADGHSLTYEVSAAFSLKHHWGHMSRLISLLLSVDYSIFIRPSRDGSCIGDLLSFQLLFAGL